MSVAVWMAVAIIGTQPAQAAPAPAGADAESTEAEVILNQTVAGPRSVAGDPNSPYSFDLCGDMFCPEDPPDPEFPVIVPPPFGCDYQLNYQRYRRDYNPEFGGWYSRVEFSSSVTCVNATIISMRTELRDKGNGRLLAEGSQLNETTQGTSSGAIDLYDVDHYPAAQQVEQILIYTVRAPAPWSWGECRPDPGSWIECSGVGTGTQPSRVGFFEFGTGVTTPCPTDRIKTDTDKQVANLDRGVTGLSAKVILTPHIEWCWSGTTVVFVKKQNNQDTTWNHEVWSDDVQSVSIKKHNGVDPDPQVVVVPALYGNNRVGHYAASFDVAITFQGTSTKVNCFLVIDRYYLDGGRKDIKDHTPICTSS